MRVVRWTLLGTGLAATALGLTLVAAPDLLGFDATLVLVGAVALAALVAVVAVHGRVATPRRTPAPPAAEGRTGWAVPGDGFDERLGGLSVTGGETDREAIAARIEATGVAVLAHHRGVGQAVAREHLAADTWTDDPVAAAFLADDPPAPTLRERVRALRTGEPTDRRRARRAIDALAAIAAVEEDRDA